MHRRRQPPAVAKLLLGAARALSGGGLQAADLHVCARACRILNTRLHVPEWKQFCDACSSAAT